MIQSTLGVRVGRGSAAASESSPVPVAQTKATKAKTIVLMENMAWLKRGGEMGKRHRYVTFATDRRLGQSSGITSTMIQGVVMPPSMFAVKNTFRRPSSATGSAVKKNSRSLWLARI